MMSQATPHKPTSRLPDLAAISLSGLCLVHCLGTTLLLGLISSGELFRFWHSAAIHFILLAIAVPLTLWTLVRSYRCHGNRLALFLGIGGLKIMALALIFHSDAAVETWLTMAGVLLLAAGHILNIRAHGRHAMAT
jgi:MerC mercury resistance protein